MAGQDEIAARMRRVADTIIPASARPGENTSGVSLMERMAFYGVPGVSIAVIHDGEIAFARGYGVRETGKPDPVTPDTLFQAASISKPVAVTGALRLVEQGLLDLDADVNEYLTTWKVPPSGGWQPRLTLRQLASHSAGLTVHGFPGYLRDAARPTLVQVLDGIPPANTPPVRVDTVPGTQFRYSGGGTSVIQQLILDVTGTPFPDLMRELVLDPLGMAASGYLQPLPESRWQEATTGHRASAGPVTGQWHIYPEMAAAGLWTTPTDLACFALGIQRSYAGDSGGILSQATAREMLTPQVPREGEWTHLGLGPFLAGEGETARFGHSGGNEGFRCLMVAYRSGKFGAVVMTNGDEGGTLVQQEIFGAIARVFDWPGFLPKQPVRIDVPADTLDRYTGLYQLRPGFTLTVTRDGDTLSVQPTGQAPLIFSPASEATFFSDSIDTKLTFEAADAGTVTGVRFQQNGREIIGNRV
jgi:CubicO group peptidase (beta-lactamase class C family)